MGCCGKKAGTLTEYLVKLNNGESKTVKTIAEARVAIATGGGGSYKAVLRKEQ